MKKISLSLIFAVLCAAASAQTRIIAYKSHSGSQTSFADEKDGNFGLDPRMEIDTIVKLSEDCIVTVNGFRMRDTMCGKYNYLRGMSLSEIRTFYYSNVVYIGFPEEPYDTEQKKPQPIENSLYLLGFILLFSGGVYTLSPRLISRK